MAAKQLTGIWRSYKTFYASGGIRKHSTSMYLEVRIDEEQLLTIAQYPAPTTRSLLVQTDNWDIRKVNEKTYLYIYNKQAYEIITLDESNLVLVDPVRGEKLFFAPLPVWRSYMYEQVAPGDSDGRITIWSDSLIELFEQ